MARSITTGTPEGVMSTFAPVDIVEDGPGWAILISPQSGNILGVDSKSRKSCKVRTDEVLGLYALAGLTDAERDALRARLDKRTPGAFSAPALAGWQKVDKYVQAASTLTLGADAVAKIAAGSVAHRKRESVPVPTFRPATPAAS